LDKKDLFVSFVCLGHYDSEDPYPSLSDYHDYEPQLEFDDSELLEQKPEDLGDEGKVTRVPVLFMKII
jgi:hypothetical protein